MKKKIAICIGTRPEAIKMAPLILLLKQDTDFVVSVCSTGQHKEMVDPILSFFGIVPDVDFALMNKTRNILDLMSQLMSKLDTYLDEEKPDLVIAQGDTTSVFSSAMAAYYKQIPFAHVEAGLRTNNIYSPWPEEGNRAAVAPITTLHFAPTELNRKNLLKENVSDKKIFVTGNTVIDALRIATSIIASQPVHVEGFEVEQTDKKIILVTGHRRENIGENFENIFSAIADLAKLRADCVIVFPVHKNPSVRRQVESLLGLKKIKNVFLIEPQGYPEFVYLMQKAYFIISDSGGIQEEAPSLGIPVLVTRDTTERPESVEAGGVRLIGTDRKTILHSCIELLDDDKLYSKMATSQKPFGDGFAAVKIVSILKEQL